MPLEKRSISLSGHRTSIALEPAFWAVLERMAAGGTLAALVAGIDAARIREERTGSDEKLASALRVAALMFVQTIARHAEDGPRTGPVLHEETPCPASPTAAPPAR